MKNVTNDTAGERTAKRGSFVRGKRHVKRI